MRVGGVPVRSIIQSMNNRFAKLEARMEALVEGTFARLFAGRVHPRDVVVQLTRALEDSALRGAPALRYAVRLNPADAQALLGEQPRLAGGGARGSGGPARG